jgi:hypothetical protein
MSLVLSVGKADKGEHGRRNAMKRLFTVVILTTTAVLTGGLLA